MKKRFLSIMLSLCMVLTFFPATAFAEGSGSDPESEQIPSSADEAFAELNKQLDVYEQNKQLAESKQDAAAKIIEDANDAISQEQKKAEDAKNAAEEAGRSAADQQSSAAEAAADTKDSLLDAGQASSKQEAEQAADQAEKSAETAREAADSALVQSDTAAQKAEDARAAYEQAQKIADDANAEAARLLAEGLESAEAAAENAKEAAEKAQKLYDELVTLKAEADAAKEKAQSEVETAKQELKTAQENLDQAIAENNQNTQDKESIKQTTGEALEAAEAAVEQADQTLEKYEKNIAALEEAIASLKEDIKDADAAIEKAQAEIDALNADDAALAVASKELKEAQNAKAAAQSIVDSLQELLDARDEAETNGRYAAMKELQAAVADNSATAAQIQELTQMVLEDELSEDHLGYIKFDENDENIFWIVDENGELVKDEHDKPQSYMVVVTSRADDTSMLQFQKAEKQGKLYTGELPDPATVERAHESRAVKNYIAYDVDGNPCNIEVDVTFAGGETIYTYEIDGKTIVYEQGRYYIFVDYCKGDTSRPFTIYDISQLTWVTVSDPLKTNSDTVTDKWANAEKAAADLADAIAVLDEKKSAFDAEKKSYDSAMKELNIILNLNLHEKEKAETTIKGYEEHMVYLNKQINGTLSDQALRGMIQKALGETSDVDLDSINKLYTELREKSLNGQLSADEQEMWEELKDLDEKKALAAQILALIDSLKDGVSPDEVKSVTDLLGRKDFSAMIQEYIAKTLKAILESLYKDASDTLDAAQENAKKELAEKRQIVDNASSNLTQKELALKDTSDKADVAQSTLDNAGTLKDKAQKAATDAAAALEAYRNLIARGLKVNNNVVASVKETYDTVVLAAADAKEAADTAMAEALNAEQDAALARQTATNYSTDIPTSLTESNPNSSTLDKTASTGDNSNLALWFALLAVSAAGAISAGVYSKRRRSSRAK